MVTVILLMYVLGLIVIWGLCLLSAPTFMAFVIFFFLILLFSPPKKAFSPLSIFYAYYGAWFLAAPMFASRYRGVLDLPEYSLSIAFAYTVFGLGVLSIRFGEEVGARLSARKPVVRKASPRTINLAINLFYIISTLCVVMIVQSTGGFEKWLRAPGDAFLARGGSGVYVILSHFSSITLACLVGFKSFNQKKFLPLLLYVAWVLLTSPVHGSKLQICLLLIMATLPWLRMVPFLTVKTFVVYIVFVAIFLLGLYFRNLSWVGFDTIIPYALNYFTALENLAISVRDFSPDLMRTFFLPFVKFQTPFGLDSPKMYFDMNHYLTDIYYPSAWAIRATEQWPVETDLYLNFLFFGGLPFVSIYLWIIGFCYGRALKLNSLGHWSAAFLMIVFMLSHLRGSLINHTDFYLYPFIIGLFLLFKNMYLNTRGEVKGREGIHLKSYVEALKNEVAIDKHIYQLFDADPALFGYIPRPSLWLNRYRQKKSIVNFVGILARWGWCWGVGKLYFLKEMWSLYLYFSLQKNRIEEVRQEKAVALAFSSRAADIIHPPIVDQEPAAWIVFPWAPVSSLQVKKSYDVFSLVKKNDFYHAWVLANRAVRVMNSNPDTRVWVLQTYTAYKFFLVRIALCRLHGTDIFISEHYDRWAVLADQVVSRLKKKSGRGSLSLIQHGVLRNLNEVDGVKTKYSLKIPHRLQSVDELYIYDELSRDFFIEEVLNSSGELKVNFFKPSLSLVAIPCDKKRILFVGHPLCEKLHLLILSFLEKSYDFKVYYKPHPANPMSEEVRSGDWEIINDKNLFPEVEFVISYPSTLESEYSAMGVRTFSHPINLQVTQIEAVLSSLRVQIDPVVR